MKHSQRLRDKALNLLKNNSYKYVSEDLGISETTLRKWRKECDLDRNISKDVKTLNKYTVKPPIDDIKTAKEVTKEYNITFKYADNYMCAIINWHKEHINILNNVIPREQVRRIQIDNDTFIIHYIDGKIDRIK